MLLSIEPILDTLITKALPAAMARTQGELLLQHLVDMARETADVPVQIAVPVGAYAAVSRLVSDHPGMVIEVIEDAGLKPAQADIRIGQTMREIDSDRVLAHFSDAIDAFYHQIREETRNG
jgi:flagellar assembly protein FliH